VLILAACVKLVDAVLVDFGYHLAHGLWGLERVVAPGARLASTLATHGVDVRRDWELGEGASVMDRNSGEGEAIGAERANK
jgi:hypothetical protein